MSLSMQAAVTFEAGPRPEAEIVVHLEEFEGPLSLLLALIEARRLDVRTVPLATITGAYVDALAGLEIWRLDQLSAFVAIAGQLILIKSRALLPQPSAEVAADEVDLDDPEESLRRRLIEFAVFRRAAATLSDRLGQGSRLFRREILGETASLAAGRRAESGTPGSGADRTLDPGLLAVALAGLRRITPPPEPPPEVVRRVITLDERIAVLQAALAGADRLVLQDLLAGTADRLVSTVTFLALLELMRRGDVDALQDKPFGPILVRRLHRGAPAGRDQPAALRGPGD